jgi:hypothetical protein
MSEEEIKKYEEEVTHNVSKKESKQIKILVKLTAGN